MYFIGIELILVKLSQSVTLTLLVLFVYNMSETVFSNDATANFPHFYDVTPLTDPDQLLVFVPYLTVGLILIIVSSYIPNRIN